MKQTKENHDPKNSHVKVGAGSKGQEGEVRNMASPSSFEKEMFNIWKRSVLWDDFRDYMFSLISKYFISKSIVERDYITREGYERLKQEKYRLIETIIKEKQKVLDFLDWCENYFDISGSEEDYWIKKKQLGLKE